MNEETASSSVSRAVESSYQTFLKSAGGKDYLDFLVQSEKNLIFQARTAKEPLEALAYLKMSAGFGSARDRLESFTPKD